MHETFSSDNQATCTYVQCSRPGLRRVSIFILYQDISGDLCRQVEIWLKCTSLQLADKFGCFKTGGLSCWQWTLKEAFLIPHPFLSYKPFWDKCTEWPEKWHWTLQGQMCSIYMLLVPPSPKFQSPLLCDQPLSNYRQVHRRTQKGRILQGQRYPIYVLLIYHGPKFQSVSLYGQSFLSYKTLWE